MNYNIPLLEVKLPEEPVLFSATSLYASLTTLVDKRKARGKRYALALLLSIGLLAKLAGQNTPQEVAHWARLRKKELCQFLGLKREEMPHLCTWNRVLGGAIEPEELDQHFCQFFQKGRNPEVPQKGQVILNLDGKTLRGTIALGHTKGVHLLAAYLPEEGLVLAQLEVDCKENEIVIAPKLLAKLDLRGMVVTGDAMHAQRAISAQIVEAGGDYLWFVKGNQPGVLTDLEVLFGPEPSGSPYPTDFSQARSIDKGHGRLEERVITVSSMLKDFTPWPSLEQAFKLERWVTNAIGQTSYEVRYGITSLGAGVADATRLLKVARAEWGIENKLHYRRDETLGEDWYKVRTGRAPQVWATLNNAVLGLLARAGVSNVAQRRRELAYLPAQAISLLFS
jgi:predicted transposase YbfD/YdcC